MKHPNLWSTSFDSEEGLKIFDVRSSKLRPVSILVDGDFHELAVFVLRGYEARKNRGATSRMLHSEQPRQKVRGRFP